MGDLLHLLDYDLYKMTHADRLLRVTPGTMRRWLEGHKGALPLIRRESAGKESVTWGEFVEARLLCEYRQLGISVFKMRPAISKLREMFDTQYPLAVAQPFLSSDGLDLIMRVQEETDLDPRLWFVIRTGQLILPSPAVLRFDKSTDRDESIVRRIHMTDNIVLDPEYSSGALTIKGRRLRVASVAGAVKLGNRPEEVAEMCDISVDAVQDAMSYADIA